MSYILGVSGSPRRNGNSDTLLKQALAGAAEAGARTEAVYLRNVQFSSCVGCERCRKDKICTKLIDGMSVLYPKIQEAKGLVVVSPAHNYNVTALMKAFIDRYYCFYDFTDDRPRGWSSRLAGQGRKSVIIGICEQPEGEGMGQTMEMMKLPFSALGYELVGEQDVHQVFDVGAVKKQEQDMEQAFAHGRNLALALQTT